LLYAVLGLLPPWWGRVPPDVLSAAAAAYVEALRRHALGALDALLSAAAEKRIAMDAERHRREVAAADDASTLLGLWHGHRAALNGLGA
jgi:hypothetical protein